MNHNTKLINKSDYKIKDPKLNNQPTGQFYVSSHLNQACTSACMHLVPPIQMHTQEIHIQTFNKISQLYIIDR